jgi:hypothetical protein
MIALQKTVKNNLSEILAVYIYSSVRRVVLEEKNGTSQCGNKEKKSCKSCRMFTIAILGFIVGFVFAYIIKKCPC